MSDTFQQNTFTPKNVFQLKVGWPNIYQENVKQPFVFHMRVQLVSEAERIQREYLMMSDDEQRAAQHQHDVEMLSLLSVAPPEGFVDFPAVNGEADSLSKAIKAYFIPGDPERLEGMRFIVSNTMNRYWRVVMPSDYL